MGKKIQKSRIGKVLFGGVLLLIFLTAGIKYWIAPMLIRKELESACASIRGTLTVGRISFSFPYTVQLHNLTLKLDHPKPVFSAKKVTASLEELPWPGKTLRVGQISLVEPHVIFHPGLVGIKGSSGGGGTVRVNQLEITDGRITWPEGEKDKAMSVSQIDMGLKIEQNTYSVQHFSAEVGGSELKLMPSKIVWRPKDRELRVDDLFARYLDGEMRLDAVLDFGDKACYTGALLVRDVRLDDLYGTGEQSSPYRGRITAGAFFVGQLHSPYHLRGRGQVQIRDAHLWKISLFERLLSFMTVQRPGAKTLSAGEAAFSFSEEGVKITSAELADKRTALHATGKVDYQGNLDLVVIAAFLPKLQSNIPVLGRITGALQSMLGRGLWAVEVSGPATEAKVRPHPRPVTALSDTAKAFLKLVLGGRNFLDLNPLKLGQGGKESTEISN